ncbi:MAG: glucose-6-phosphate dehydrogenase assembly protein OpcA, partial [Cellulomonas sp.]|nr:glucose-6-phosphate dehydrogenase assembly protein OpcA [Cellulomonas sp.]
MIIDLPDTTTRDLNKRLVEERDEGGVVALGRVLTLVIDVGQHDPEEAIDAANAASREHPCRIIVLSTIDERSDSHLAAQIRLGGDAGASEVVVLYPAGELQQHLDTLVTPLLLPDAPIVVWWPFEVPDDPAEHPIGRMGVRRITDTTQCSSPTSALRR